MGEVINFNRARKQRDKAAAKATAGANRARFGRSKADKTAQDAERKATDRALDGVKREDD